MGHDFTTTVANLEAVLADIVAAIAEQAPPIPSRPRVTVRHGDNLAALVAAGLPDTIFVLPGDYVFGGDVDLARPCTLTHAGFAQLAPGRTTAAFVGPSIKGTVTTHAPINFCGIRLDGIAKDATVLDVQPGSAGTAVERCVVQAGPQGSRRGIALTGGGDDFTIRRSHVGNHWYAGSETQAIGAVYGAHRVLVEDCLLEASGENIMLGGDEMGGSAAAICTDWQILDSTLSKPLAWQTNGATVKNLFELKAAQRVLMKHCLLERNWVGAQIGYGIVLTVRNQYNHDPFATVQDIEVTDTILRGVAGGIQILGRDDTIMKRPDGSTPPATGKVGPNPGDTHQSVRMARVAFHNLRIEDLSRDTWGGNGRTISIAGGPKDLVFDGLTVTKGRGAQPIHSALIFDQPQFPTEGFVMRNAVLDEGEYGLHSSEGLGKAALDLYAPGYQWDRVTMIEGGARWINYPAGTTKVPMTPRL